MPHLAKHLQRRKIKAWVLVLWFAIIQPLSSTAQNAPIQAKAVSIESSLVSAIPSKIDSLDANLQAEDFMKKAIIHFDAARYTSCLNNLNEAIALNTANQLKDILFFYRAVCQSKMKQNAAAIEDYNLAIFFNPTKVKYHYYRGLSFFDMGNFEKAEADFEYTLLLQGEDADLLLKIGFLKEQNKQQQAALDCYSKALVHNPKLAEAYYLRGLLHLRVLLHKKACQDLNKAAQLKHPAALKTYSKYCNAD